MQSSWRALTFGVAVVLGVVLGADNRASFRAGRRSENWYVET